MIQITTYKKNYKLENPINNYTYDHRFQNFKKEVEGKVVNQTEQC